MGIVEKEQKIELSDEQREAVLAALTHGVQVITGGPGTGKTTIIRVLLQVLETMEAEVMLAAPTGRAAKRMTEATGHEASTIHRMLEMQYLDENASSYMQQFQRNEENPIEADVIIVDEMSMVDIQLMHNLLKGIAPGTRLILVGDADQLPSVGPGNVLRDIIESGMVPTTRLNQIYRQAEESDIVLNAHRINHGEYPEFNRQGTDFFLMRRQVREGHSAHPDRRHTAPDPEVREVFPHRGYPGAHAHEEGLSGCGSPQSLAAGGLEPAGSQEKRTGISGHLLPRGRQGHADPQQL